MTPITYQAVISSPIGKIGIRSSEESLVGIDYLHEDEPVIKPRNIMAKEAVEQLLCYFADPTFAFEIPLLISASAFQKRVLELLKQIPVGTTQSYTDVAKQLKTSPRPVGNACRKNPIPIVIPCHRVVAEKDIGGYHGDKQAKMIEIKRWLLQHESGSRA